MNTQTSYIFLSVLEVSFKANAKGDLVPAKSEPRDITAVSFKKGNPGNSMGKPFRMTSAETFHATSSVHISGI